MNYLGNNKSFKDENNYWNSIKIAEVDDKVISQLIDKLKLDLSEDFYISFESLLKIGEKAEDHIKSYIDQIEENLNFKREIFTFLLKSIGNNEIEKPLVYQLYHPDFIIRAKAIMNIEENGDLQKYFNYLIPLIGDPDDSVRWAVINLFSNHDQIENPLVLNKLKNQMKRESNKVIRERIKAIISYQ